jgi:hypothetical protein
MCPRPSVSALLVWALAAGCAERPAPPPDRLVADVAAEAPPPALDDVAIAGDAAAVDGADALVDAALDAPLEAETMDAGIDVPRPIACGLDASRPAMRAPYNGFLRFVNLARGVGTVRFMVRTLPLYRRAYLEAVVPEGASSGYLETLGVSYQVRVAGAPGAEPTSLVIESNDAGVVEGAPARPDVTVAPCDAGAEGDEIADALCADVYFMAGCTVFLTGSITGDRDAGTQLRLVSATDLSRRSQDCDGGLVRVMPAYTNGPLLDVDLADGTPLARGAAYLERGGQRAVRAGAQTVEARGHDGGMPIAPAAPVGVTPGHPHTLYLWGDALNSARPGATATLLDDLPPAFW